MKIIKTDGMLTVEPEQMAYLDGMDVEFAEKTLLTEDALIAEAADADALLVLREPITPRVLAALPKLKVIGRFGVGLDAALGPVLAERPDLLVTDLRSIAVQGLVAAEHLPPLAEAKALLLWHARHRFCSACGHPSAPDQAGWRRVCPSCGAEHFPRTDPVVIMLAIDGERCLLGRQARFAPGMWSCLAGFVEPGENIEEAVRRETLEEAGIRCGRVHYVASQPWPFPMSLMIGCYAEALDTDLVIDRTELEDLRWFSREEVVALLDRRHPDGLFAPPPIAIAHFIMRSWIEDAAGGFGRPASA